MIKWGHLASIPTRVVVCLIVMFLSVVLIPTTCELFETHSAWVGLIIIICIFGNTPLASSSSFLIGLFDGALQTSLYALAGPLPPSYAASLNQGFGSSGVVICALRAVSLLTLPPSGVPGDNNLLYGAVLYMALSALIIVFNLVGLLYALKSPFTRHFHSKIERTSSPQLEDEFMSSGAAVFEMDYVEKSGFRLALKEAWGPALTTVFVYAMTMSLYPGTVLQAGFDSI